MWIRFGMLIFMTLCRSVELAEDTLNDLNLADDYLATFGYYQLSEPRVQNLVMRDDELVRDEIATIHSDTERRQAIKKFQLFFGLPQTGRLDEKTIKLMESPRCGVVDNPSTRRSTTEGRRHRRYAYYKTPDGRPAIWTQSELTWRITQRTGQFPEDDQRRLIRRALDIWGEVVPVTFREITEGDPDIDIRFAKGNHGGGSDPKFDGSPKDKANILAHAWGPNTDPRNEPGDVHFDDDDTWTVQNFLAVAAHELGHSMGLVHSTNPSAIMYPLYKAYVNLSDDDLKGIRYIYNLGTGRRPTTPRPTKAPPQPRIATRMTLAPIYPRSTPSPVPRSTMRPLSENNICTRVNINSIFKDPSDHHYVVISGVDVHKLSSAGQLIKTESLSVAFPQAPRDPDVAFASKHSIYFIKDYRIWMYSGHQLLPDYPRPLSRLALPEVPKFAILFTDRILMFGKTKWWTFHDSSDKDRSLPISQFASRFPDDVVFAAQWTDQIVYAVSRSSYTMIDRNRKVINEEPIPGMPDWLHQLCSSCERTRSLNFIPLLLLSAINFVIAKL